MNQQVLRISVKGTQLSVLASRIPQRGNSRCFNCEGHAAEIKLTIDQVYDGEGEITGNKLDEIRPAIASALAGHKFGKPVCGSPRCYNSFLAILPQSVAA